MTSTYSVVDCCNCSPLTSTIKALVIVASLACSVEKVYSGLGPRHRDQVGHPQLPVC